MLGAHGIRSAPSNDQSRYNDDDEADDDVFPDTSSTATVGASAVAITEGFSAAEMTEEDYFVRIRLGIDNVDSVSDEDEEDDEDGEEPAKEGQVAQAGGSSPLVKLRKGIRKVQLQGSTYATVTLTIAAYNTILDGLEDYIDQDDSRNNRQQRRQTRHYDLVRGAVAAREKLLQYYRSTDDTPIYAVATAMHPAMRFDWWTREPQNWEKVVADEAKKVVTEIWNTQYKPDPLQAMTEQSIPEDGADNSLVAELDLIGAPDLQVVTGCRELEDYVAATYKRALPLQFWAQHDVQTESGLPNVAKMARDFLAVPATSGS
ncbi:hypothetical protein BG000_005111 [Podila horticola]|nr:hypothetical protein BG000_005111 [Podila horticola]